MKNAIKTTLAAFAGLFAAVAAWGYADVAEVVPCESTWPYADITSYPINTTTNAYASGEKIFFKVRLANVAADAPWVISPTTNSVDWAVNPIKIGLFPRGELDYAELVTYQTVTNSSGVSYFTDFIFKYTTQVGDFALPLVLAGKSTGGTVKPINIFGSSTDTIGLYLDPSSTYSIKATNDYGRAATLARANLSSPDYLLWRQSLPNGSQGAITLYNAGIYIKTVGFDSNGDSDDIWRTIQAGSTYLTSAYEPTLAVTSGDGTSDEARTYYVWSEDDDKLYPYNGSTVEMVTNYVGGVAQYATKHVATVTIPGGSTVSDSFTLISPDTSHVGETVNLIMSAWQGYQFVDGDYTLLTNLYITATVAITNPPSPTVKMTISPATITNAVETLTSDGLYKPLATLTVTVSPSYSNDVDVVISNYFSNASDTGTNYGDYIRYVEASGLDEDGYAASLPDYAMPTATISAGGSATYYILALKSDTCVDSSTHRLAFHANVDTTAYPGIEIGSDANLRINTAGPTVSGDSLDTIGFQVNIGKNVTLKVDEDTYADQNSTTGYKVEIKYDGTEDDSAYESLGTFYRSSDGTLTNENGKVLLTYTKIVSSSAFRVTSPVSGATTVLTFTPNVSDGPDPTGAFYSDSARTTAITELDEGGSVYFSGSVSNLTSSTATYYAFLVPTNTSGDVTITTNLFSAAAQKFVVCPDTDTNTTSGLSVEISGTAGTFKTSGAFQILDGSDLDLDFKVVLCSSEKYSPSNVVYTSTKSISLMVNNVAPVASKIKMASDTGKDFGSATNGATFTSLVPPNAYRVFTLADVDAIDVALDLDSASTKTEWTIVYPSDMNRDDSTTTITGYPGNASCALTNQFTASGSWGIKVRVQDKDGAWSDYVSTTVKVIDAADRYLYVDLDTTTDTIDNVKGISENISAGSDDLKVKVGLNYWDYAYTGSITVRVDVVSRADSSATDKGTLEFGSSGVVDSGTIGDTNWYYIVFSSLSSRTMTINRNTLDGTGSSSDYGFMINATVVTTNTLPTSGQAANEFYLPANDSDDYGEITLFVRNIDPVPTMPNENSDTNKWNVAGASAQAISWAVSDVTPDLSLGWPNDASKTGVLVQVTGVNLVNPTNIYATASSKSGTFQPDFGSNQGDGTVVFLFIDKDGGQSQQYTYYYYVRPSKFLTIASNGPSSGDGDIAVSQIYAEAEGRGEGHVFVEDATATRSRYWTMQWNCNTMAKATVYAYPYSVGDKDDGNLDGGNDQAIGPDGNWNSADATALTSYYTYSDSNYDSFFLGWIKPASTDVENTEYTVSIAPKFTGNLAYTSVTLPTALLEDETGYAGTYMEAIFSKEWRPADNMGDINNDGVPDYYTYVKKYGEGTAAVELITPAGVSADLGNVATLNDDLDFYPSGGTGTPGVPSTWTADTATAFNTYREIRGQHPGLNYGMFKVDKNEYGNGWISDLDLSYEEKNYLFKSAQACAEGSKWPGAQAAAIALTNDLVVCGNDYNAWLDIITDTSDSDYAARTNSQALAKAFIDATWAGYISGDDSSEWGFTVENRTDPTMDDTDGDGMPDGYEYYFWYQATIGATNKNGVVEFFTGKKFSLRDIETPEEITSADIAALYNPRISTDWTKVDTDNDGLYDKEEMLIGTNPCKCDSDGDNLPDLYEVLWNINPLSSQGKANTGDNNNDGDYMARANVGHVSFGETIADYFYIYAATNASGTRYFAVDRYISSTVEEVTTNCIEVAQFNGDLIPLTEHVTPDNIYSIRTLAIDHSQGYTYRPIQLYHHQVYNYYGFDPRTGWYSDPDNGTLSPSKRWKEKGGAPGGYPENTMPFSALDEFLLLKYRYIVGLRSVGEDMSKLADGKTTIIDILKGGCTNPQTAFESYSYAGDLVDTAANTRLGDPSTQHGADTDGDAVPDGWELYVGVNPNIDYRIRGDGEDALYWSTSEKYSDGYPREYIGDNTTYEEDGLKTLVEEYAGTDSTLAYQACETVYANYPGNTNGVHALWYNKFFPTDPRDNDTDSDGVMDGVEKKEWKSGWVYNRWGQNGSKNVKHFVIYGSPSDNISRCIPGGGMNPCTIDTDEDGLPDLWERQYAGLLMNGSSPADGVFTHGVPDDEVYDDIRAAVAARSTKAAALDEDDAESTDDDDDDEDEDKDTGNSANYYVMMGMDPTVPDAGSSLTIGAPDLDWDGDGLQNWQEYLVQSLRHLRYDDCRTPLMGCDIPLFDSGTMAIEKGDWVATNGYLRLSFTSEFSDNQLATIADKLGYKHFAEYAQEHPDYLRELGYFADPPRYWDKAGLNFSMKYMLPPTLYWDVVVEGDPVQSKYTEYYTTNSFTLAIEHDLYGVAGSENTAAPLGYDLVFTNGLYDAGLDKYLYAVSNTYGSIAIYTAPLLFGGTEYAVEVVPIYSSIETNLVTYSSRSSYYLSADPRLWDTDNDGMDDYWELYHGLNPILGFTGTFHEDTGRPDYDEQSDIIFESYYFSSRPIAMVTNNMYVSTFRNAWIGWDNTDTCPYDPIRFPWMMGTGDCDADSDGIRNADEAIMANLTSPAATHTDPTPLWITDVSSDMFPYESVTEYTGFVTNAEGNVVSAYDKINHTFTNATYTFSITNAPIYLATSPSYTRLYYRNTIYNYISPVRWPTVQTSYLYDFEENEGYDTDADFRSDYIERKSAAEPASDPLDFTDPARRQSIWFGGQSDPGLAINYHSMVRNSIGQDLFKQFTVEAWVRPEEQSAGTPWPTSDQYILSRSSNYSGWDIPNSNVVIRTNFALGIDTNGFAFAEMEDSTRGSMRVTAESKPLSTNAWAHVAGSFDGSTFRIYVNGEEAASRPTSMIPANGVWSTTQDPHYNSVFGFPYSTYYVGPSATIIGGKAAGPGAFSATVAATTNWSGIATGFYRGSVDEVRFWDGARSVTNILEDIKTRYTIDSIKERRETIYGQFINGARRNDAMGREVLAPELVQHYTFNALAGATEAQYVQRIPAGFATNVLTSVNSPDVSILSDGGMRERVKIAWWNEIVTNPVLSANGVYTNGWTVPWIQNTVAHLPRLSGLFKDSMFWSDYLAGYSPASWHDLEKFDIPNAMSPYYREITSGYKEDYTLLKLRKLAGYDSDLYAGLLSKYRFDRRYEFNGTGDLVPVGAAYAKRLADSWDEGGPEDAWAITTDGTTDDGDPTDSGLPDWWTGSIDAYVTALENGLLSPGVYSNAYSLIEYLKNKDSDGDGISDYLANLYGLNGSDGLKDFDYDGLSNYSEYLLTNIFGIASFDPSNAFSVAEYDSDYFFKIGQVYAGEIFTDHDFMEDTWEDAQSDSYASRYVWDARSDKDEDGWSAFAECRYNQFVSTIVAKNASHMLNGVEMRDVPVPALRLTVRYNGDQSLLSSASGSSTNTLATLYVSATSDLSKSVTEANWAITPGESMERTALVGLWRDAVVGGTLTPGNINPKSVGIEFMAYDSNDVYTWKFYSEDFTSYAFDVGTYEEYLEAVDTYGLYGVYYQDASTQTQTMGRIALATAGNEWTTFSGDNVITVTSDSSTENGYICFHGERIGSINLVTGEYLLDLGAFEDSGLSSTNGTDGVVTIANSLIRINYSATVPVYQSDKLSLSLGLPDSGEPGYLKEGKTRITAFYDLDDDGKYTLGEPFGTLDGVDVGWYKGEATVELTDEGLRGSRVDLVNDVSESGLSVTNVTALSSSKLTRNISATSVESGSKVRVRVVRYSVCNTSWANLYGDAMVTVFDKTITVDDATRTCLTESDFVGEDEFDIGSNHALSVADGVTAVAYYIVIGDGDVYYTSGGTMTRTALNSAIVRYFDTTWQQPTIVTPGINGSMGVTTASPTFVWSMTNDTYSAFRILVTNATQKVVWDSGIRQAPARDANGYYTFEPDLYAGDLLQPGTNYQWSVSMYNSKFSTNNVSSTRKIAWSDPASFVMNVSTNSLTYGTIDVCARYLGPEIVLTNSVVRIEAFATPDFTGRPVARTFVSDTASAGLTNAEHAVNARLIGLPEGTYYIRGYVDDQKYKSGTKTYTNGVDRVLDDWEPWGYVCSRDESTDSMFRPLSVTVTANAGTNQIVSLYIEDVDVNGNSLPDAWEMVVNAGSLYSTLATIDQISDGGIMINNSITDNLLTNQLSGAYSSVASLLTSSLNNAGVAALVLNVTPTAGQSTANALLAAASGISTTAEATLNITNITLTSGGAVVLETEATDANTTTTTVDGTAVARQIYAASGTPSEIDVSVPILYSTDLVNWTVMTNITIRVAGSSASIPDGTEIQIPDEIVNSQSKCFFAVGSTED